MSWARGAENPKFKHGLGAQHKVWVDAVRSSNPLECRICRANVDLHLHHIYPVKIYPELRFISRNGAICCRTCHFRYEDKPEVFGVSLDSFEISGLTIRDNLRVRADNKTGYPGISFHPASKGYYVRIGVSGNRIQHETIFKTLEEAIIARLELEDKYWFQSICPYCDDRGRVGGCPSCGKKK